MTFAESARALCGVAARALGWRPTEFWQATPAELMTCLGEPDHAALPPTPAELAELMKQFPDRS